MDRPNPSEIADPALRQQWEDYYQANPSEDPRRTASHPAPPPAQPTQAPSQHPPVQQVVYVEKKKSLIGRLIKWGVLGFIGLIAVVAIAAIATSGGGDDDVDTASESEPVEFVDEVGAPGQPANPGVLYPDRPGQEDEDHEALLGSGTGYAGINIYVSSANIEGDRLVVEGRFYNRDEGVSHDLSFTDFSLQDPNGIILQPDIFGDIATPEIISGVSADFRVEFEVPPSGTSYIIHENTFSFDVARGVWAVEVP